MKIEFSNFVRNQAKPFEHNLSAVDPIDLMNFTQTLSFNTTGDICNIEQYKRTQDPAAETMVNVEIKFTVWEGDMSNGAGVKHVWKCYRAKNHSCSNSHIEEIKK